MVQEINSLPLLRQHLHSFWRDNATIGFVPTMGALHDGHLSLVKAAKAVCDVVVVSIFVNPLQFAAHEDFDRYPQRMEQDKKLLQQAGVTLLYLPQAAIMYPPGFATRISVSGVSEGLCGAARPGHFTGVATVVAKLLNQVQPQMAFFGEKDYQQLQVIKRMVSDLDMPVEIHGVATMREADGLAMSSRNLYLTPDERAIAPLLHRMLQNTKEQLLAGAALKPLLKEAVQWLMSQGFSSVDYVSLNDAENLENLSQLDRPARLLAAAKLGNTRLIDNVAVEIA